MAENHAGEPPGLAHQLHLLQQLGALVREQAAAHHTLQTEHDRLQRAVAEAVTRLTALAPGARASRAELQAIIDALHAAQAPSSADPQEKAGRDTPSTDTPAQP